MARPRYFERLVSSNRTGGVGLPDPGVLARWNVGISPSICDGIVTLSGVICAISRDATDFLIGGALIKEFGQHRRITYIASGDLDGSNLLRFLIDPKVCLAPATPFGATVLACVPFTFALSLDPHAVH